jgi:hypothetical protein
MSFAVELRNLINKYNRENGSDTPDFVLANYLLACLEAFDEAMTERACWYGRERQGEK